MESPKIGGVDHIAVRVTDPAELGKFLTEVLGLTRRGTETRGLYALPGGTTLAVFPVGADQGGIGERATPRLPDHIAVKVDHYQEFEAYLKSRGYELDGDMLIAPGGLCLQFVG